MITVMRSEYDNLFCEICLDVSGFYLHYTPLHGKKKVAFKSGTYERCWNFFTYWQRKVFRDCLFMIGVDKVCF